jgi:thiol-disulfide isomerase/thioredoxin
MKPVLIIAAVLVSFSAGAQTIPKLKMTDVVQRMNRQNDTTYIINFWATFCKPCVAEIPGFLKVTEKYKSKKVKLILVSLDLPSYYPKRIADFVAKNKWKAGVAWLNETNADYFCPLIDSSWSGAIPATIIVNATRGYKKFWEGELSEQMLDAELKRIAAIQQQNGYLGKFSSPMKSISGVLDDTEQSGPAYIRTDAVTFFSNDTAVYAVSDGMVISVADIEGMTVLIIKNDNLLFTYSNLKTVHFKKGDIIKKHAVIGYAGKNSDDAIAVDIYLSNHDRMFTLRKENFVAESNADFYSLPPKDREPQ